MRLNRTKLGIALALFLAACGGDRTPPDSDCTPRDYLVSDAVHPFTATYGGHCTGLYFRDVYESVFRSLGDEVYLQGTPDGKSYGVWASDGTPTGTRRLAGSTSYEAGGDVPFVRELLPGSGGTFFFMDTRCYFPNQPPVPPATPLWWSPGHDAVELVLGDRHVRSVTRAGETVYFTADSPVSPASLWAVPVAGRPAREVARFSVLSNLTPAATRGVVFFADSQPWLSDGSSAGTYDLGAGCDSVSSELVVVGAKAYFVCPNDRKLWASDFSSRSSKPVPGAPIAPIARTWGLAEFGGRLAFFHQTTWGTSVVELWMSDGKEGGTRRLASLGLPQREIPATSLVVGNLLYFFVDDALWRTDGTSEGTRSVAQLPPKDATYGHRGPRALAEVGGALYVLANDAELWQVDAVGARRLILDSRISSISAMAAGRSRLFYGARDSEESSLPMLRAWGCPAS